MRNALTLLLLLPCTPYAFSVAHAAVAEEREALGGEDLSSGLERIRSEHGVPGMVVLAVQEGEVLAWGAAGHRVSGEETPISIHDPVHLGSCSKAITATLVARLVEAGALDWSTTVKDALPEFAEGIDPGYHDTTPLTFLQHRAGIAERKRPEVAAHFLVMSGMEGSGPVVRRGVLEKVLALPPSLPADGTYDYSNYGYMTVGLMLEGITSKPWEELVVEHVFEPMGLTSAGVGSPVGDDVPVGHVQDGETWRSLPPGPGGFLPDAMAPAGLVHMNLMDWAKFVSDHMAGFRGEGAFLKSETYELLHGHPGSSYAAGWMVSEHRWDWGESALLTHSGSDNSWLSLVFALPDWDMALVLAINAAGAGSEAAIAGAQQLFLETLDY